MSVPQQQQQQQQQGLPPQQSYAPLLSQTDASFKRRGDGYPLFRLFFDPTATECISVVVFIEILGLPFTPIKPQQQQQQLNDRPNFTAMAEADPLNCLPALEEDSGFRLFQTHTILRYIAMKYAPSQGYYPADVRQRARIDTFLDWIIITFRRAFVDIGMIVVDHASTSSSSSPTADDAAQTEQHKASAPWRNQIDRFLELFETQWLKQQDDFVCGRRLTIADLVAYAELAVAKYWYGISIDGNSRFFKTQKWWKRMDEKIGTHSNAWKNYVANIARLGKRYPIYIPVEAGSSSSSSSNGTTSAVASLAMISSFAPPASSLAMAPSSAAIGKENYLNAGSPRQVAAGARTSAGVNGTPMYGMVPPQLQQQPPAMAALSAAATGGAQQFGLPVQIQMETIERSTYN